MVIDAANSLNARDITSWQQVKEIKDIIRQKLEKRGFRLDPGLEADLKGFIRMKQKNEANYYLLQNRDHATDSNYLIGQEISQKTMKICKELTKWLMRNENNLIRKI